MARKSKKAAAAAAVVEAPALEGAPVPMEGAPPPPPALERTPTAPTLEAAAAEAPAPAPAAKRGRGKGAAAAAGKTAASTTAAAASTTTAPKPIGPTDSTVREQLVNSFADKATSREIEVVFAFDTTGSMYGVIEEVRTKLKEMITRLIRDVPGIRIGAAGIGDFCDAVSGKYAVKTLDLCNDADAITSWVGSVERTFGGDGPECYEYMLQEAQKFSWHCPNRALVIIGDDVPHADSYTDQRIFWGDELDKLKAMGIKVYGVAAGNPSAEAKDFYQEISERTGGIFLELRHFKLIESMFMAVCYREFGPEGLESYRREVEGAGRMDKDSAHLFAQLKRGPSKLTEPKDRPYSWWHKGASGSPRYVLVGDKWCNAGQKAAAAAAKKARPAKAAKPAKPAKAAAEPKKKKAAAKRKKPDAPAEEAAAAAAPAEEKKPAKRRAPKKKAAEDAEEPAKKRPAPKRLAEDDTGLAVVRGHTYAIRGEDKKSVFLGRVVSVAGSQVKVQWYEELRAFPGKYALLDWTGSIPAGAVIKQVSVSQNAHTSMWTLKGKLPSP